MAAREKTMHINANSLVTIVPITLLVLAMVFLLPRIDKALCSRMNLDLHSGLSSNPRNRQLLHLRTLLLFLCFLAYSAALAWLVFFSRRASREYLVHAALFSDLAKSIHIDLGFAETFRILFRDGPSAALSHIKVIHPEDISQVYMNVMLFVPMGYLLPYIFPWFREKVRMRPWICCFILALAIENLQLISKRGFYDLDDLTSNTIGSILGQWLYIWEGYLVTHPNWKEELRRYRRWKGNAKKRTLFPFKRRILNSRTTLLGTDETAIWDFYVTKLGFRPIKQLVPEASPDTAFLLEMGASQIVILCSNRSEAIPPQHLTFFTKRIERIQSRLESNGIHTTPMTPDVYTGHRSFSFTGPDNVEIQFISLR